MNTTSKFLLITLASSLLLTGCCTQRNATATQWEYKIVSAHISYPADFKEKGFLTLGEKISQSATDGWELVSTGSDDASPFAILRKPKSENSK